MAVELKIDGYFGLSFQHVKTGKDVDLETEGEILAKLKTSEYLISLEQKTVSALLFSNSFPLFSSFPSPLLVNQFVSFYKKRKN